ncbi:hypothetical protein JZO70_14710 [Enterococcus sp. 669A]|uniref:Uncharacterized protein n=1 Tax=Candidatus Enterococcus moelleringii TaxID=2815325 RepID=A0ABS3LFC0_9ENTE|nr:hypothetical protein [Enterococcus sp. 669A]MBO1307426.1 hypothetical protein [Enterococcus sp. 669A]
MTTINLDLTPEEEKKIKDTFAKDGQSLEEGLQNLVYLLISDNDSDIQLPKMVKPKNQPIKMINNGDGTFSYPEDIPAHVKELHKFG